MFLNQLTGFAVGGGGAIFATNNGGVNWDVIELNDNNYNLHAISFGGTTGITVGNLGTAVVDSGSGWVKEDTGVGGSLYGISVLNNTNAIAVGYGGDQWIIVRRK